MCVICSGALCGGTGTCQAAAEVGLKQLGFYFASFGGTAYVVKRKEECKALLHKVKEKVPHHPYVQLYNRLRKK